MGSVLQMPRPRTLSLNSLWAPSPLENTHGATGLPPFIHAPLCLTFSRTISLSPGTYLFAERTHQE